MLTVLPVPVLLRWILSLSEVTAETDLKELHPPIMDTVVCSAHILRGKLVRPDLEISNPMANFLASNEC